MKLFNNTTQLQVFGWLLYYELRSVLKNSKEYLFDSLPWPFVIIIANGYIMPALGLPTTYGTFSCISMLVIMASFAAWTSAMPLSTDLEGPKAISYELTLPIPYWMVWSKYIIALAIRAALFNFMPLIIGKIILGSNFTLPNFSIPHFLLIYLVSCIFFASFATWSVVNTSGIERYSKIEVRLTGPLFFLCGWSASWYVMNGIVPLLGKLLLLTPWIYAYEGSRAALLGQEGFLPFWICIGMLILYALVCIAHGTYVFKKRLDCV